MWRKRTRGTEVRQGEACIRRAVIAVKLRPIDKVKNPRRIYDVGRRGWSAAIARPCVVKRRWRGPTCAHARIWKPAAGTRHMESPLAITTPWKSCRFTSGKASVRFKRLATVLTLLAFHRVLSFRWKKLHRKADRNSFFTFLAIITVEMCETLFSKSGCLFFFLLRDPLFFSGSSGLYDGNDEFKVAAMQSPENSTQIPRTFTCFGKGFQGYF